MIIQQTAKNDIIQKNDTRIGNFQEFITKTQVLQELGRTEKLDTAVLKFEEKRKRPSKGKSIETFLKMCTKKNRECFNNHNAMTKELEVVILQEHEITLQQWIDSMLNAIANNEDITEDIKIIRQAFYDFMGIVGRPCTACNDDGKLENIRLTKHQKARGNDVTVWSTCNYCKGTKKKTHAISASTKDSYLVRVDRMLRYFGLYNRVDFKNISIAKPKKIKFKPKPLLRETFIEILNTTTLKSRSVFWQFLGQSACRDMEGCKIRKSHCVGIDENAKELRNFNDPKLDRIRVSIYPEEGNKLRVERETFVHKDIQDYVLNRLQSIDDNDFVFHDYDNAETAENNESSAFQHVRVKMIENGFKEMDERKPTSRQHRITIHTLRSFFISKANRVDDSSFGTNIAGQDNKMVALYDRIDPKALLDLWKESEAYTSLESDDVASNQELQNTVNALKSEIEQNKEENQKNNQELYEKIFDLMNQLEKLKSK